jgi:glycosyltransferase involved in cell wall biosynthesis
MKILILNWRDPKHPNAGGAEILTQELAKRWIKSGHTVTQICSSFPNAQSKELIDGVTFIRMGRWWNVHFFAFYYYFRFLRNRTDIIIDEVHWFPFFSALYARKKTVALVCEVAGPIFYRIFPYPIALFWHFVEKNYLRLYQRVPMMVISPSTYKDVVASGHDINNLYILPMGISIPPTVQSYKKEKKPVFISVGRLNKQKGIFDLLKAFYSIKEQLPTAELWLVGSASPAILEDVKTFLYLHQLEKSVKLFGFLSEKKKFELLSRAHILLSASMQEGWGLTVPEAGFMKTPSVVYNIQGFRDIISNKKDGILVNTNPRSLAQACISLFLNKELYKKMQLAAEQKAKGYSWGRAADASLTFLKQYE